MKKSKTPFEEDPYATGSSEEERQNADGTMNGDGSDFSGQADENAGRAKKRSRSSGSARSREGEKEAVHLSGEKRRRNRERFQTVARYLFLGFGIFFFICLFLNLICNFGNRLADRPAEHWMGYIGYGISYALHGLFGVPALFLPVGMVTFFIFWKQLREERRLAFKLLNSIALLTLLSTLIHTFWLAITKTEIAISGGELFQMGAALKGGGFLGGKLAYLAVRFLNWAGAFVLEFILLIASFFYMLGMTPRYIITRWNHRRELSDKSNKTLSEQEAEQAKKRAKAAAEEKRAQSATVKTTPEGFPEGSVTLFQKGKAVGPVRGAAEHPPIPCAPGSDEGQLYLPADIRRKIREEEEAERRKKAMEEQRKKAGNTGNQSARITPAPAQTTPALSAPAVSEEVRTSYESADPIFPQSENKGAKKVRKEDRGFDLKTIFNDNETDEPLAQPPQHAPLPPEKPVPARTVVKKVPTTPPPPAPPEKPKEYVFPPIDLLKRGAPMNEENRSEIEQNMRLLATTLEDFRIGVRGIDYACGPTVTRYEITPAPGVHARAIMNLAGDIALAFAVSNVRMAQIEGKSAIGVEVPNKTRYTVCLRNLLESDKFRNGKSRLTVALGADVVNDPVVFDITDMPHLLVAGATKMGKSVCINCTITSLLYQAKPDEVKLVLVDPKKVEFTPYKSIPHLLAPIITSANDAAGALQAAVAEMENRYGQIEEVGVRDIEGYNRVTKNDPDKPFMPYLVIIIDELADLMLQAKDQVEEPICRLLQKGRAAGIHLILGTQRPSVDVG